MSRLPALRSELDTFPSPDRDHPGLVLRDPLHYSETILVIPPGFLPALPLFDGAHEIDALENCLASLGLHKREQQRQARALLDALSAAGFLEDEVFEAKRDQAQAEFRTAEVRSAKHAGAGYPDEPSELRATFDGYHERGPRRTQLRRPEAIVAPHVSPYGGVEAYAAAYGGLDPRLAEATFVVLGTSHQGTPECFGLTGKSFETPYGRTRAAPAIVEKLHRAAPRAAILEDYQHAVEHSIEFQVVFLQHALGRPDLEVVPVLCGAFIESLETGRPPEKDEGIRAFFDALSELRATRDNLVFVLGVDLAHVGRRYGDRKVARRKTGAMQKVEAEDQARLRALLAGEHETFLELVTRDADPLRWCGFSPLFTYLRSAPESRGRVLHYDQWNIDDDSVVSFVAAEYDRAAG